MELDNKWEKIKSGNDILQQCEVEQKRQKITVENNCNEKRKTFRKEEKKSQVMKDRKERMR